MSDVGVLLREWRGNRRLSQLELAGQAGVSTRHLSFVETGRAQPTREMILRLAEGLAVPLRARNALLLAGGFAPAYPEGDLGGPGLAAVLASLRAVLAGHEPYPAILIDRHWTLVDGNAAVPLLTAGAAPELLEPPVNVLRLSLHPDGVAPRIRNLPEWRAHVLHRLDRQALATGDPVLRSLHDELLALPGGRATARPDGLVVPLRYAVDGRELSFFSVTSVLGTPLDVTLDELAIESFLPADAATAAFLHGR
ncbi:transcriptional regulator [Actinoplanes sp. ATCC 53533]|uniref:helix-turn-helix domain-containing protein n=1 Tax=Actinoplanes sp. ATCC 53533 TaxID=1288362 RepID=UPI000F76CE1C|nr:helix-turn-helix transcriptional regulator [Actinoplanes sp. ATCC 53533]RSM72136.1 transcriptional regulator [Actinoplanes sp. ATCC 53533]